MNKEKAIKNLLDKIDMLDPSKENRAIYEELFKRQTNKEFEIWANKIKSGELLISIIVPNGYEKNKMSRDRLNTICDKLNISRFEKVTFMDNNGEMFQPPTEYNITLLPVSRMAQHQSSKMGVSKNNYKRNPITGQVTGDSKANSMTLPEIHVLNGLGLTEITDEISSIKGGDRRAMMTMEDKLTQNGEVSLAELKATRTKASSVKRLKSYFKAMHMDINV